MSSQVTPSAARALAVEESIVLTHITPALDPDRVYSSGAVVLSGAFAGIAALAVTYPLECSKTKMQVQPHRFKTLGATLYHTYRHLGVPGLYTGFHASSLQVGGKVLSAPHNGI